MPTMCLCSSAAIAETIFLRTPSPQILPVPENVCPMEQRLLFLLLTVVSSAPWIEPATSGMQKKSLWNEGMNLWGGNWNVTVSSNQSLIMTKWSNWKLLNLSPFCLVLWPMDQQNFFCKGPDKYFSLYRHCRHTDTIVGHTDTIATTQLRCFSARGAQFVNKWEWLYFNKTLFQKIGRWWAGFGPQAVPCWPLLYSFVYQISPFG